ncbi:MAG: aldose 1-epimerase family protein [Lachnospiraceae bacterium]|nr:aldose 1-epimerase family protein [Lachnospiraceae bacterium]
MQINLEHGVMRAVADTSGGELVSFKDENGTEYIWSGDPAYWSGRNPILFPIVGSLKDSAVILDGSSYTMQRHGFARRSEFSVTEQGSDFVVFSLTESPETLKQYPYPFLLSVRHQLTDEGFYTEFTVKNTGEKPLPFCIGAHTAFYCPLTPDESFEDYRLVFDQAESASSLMLTSGGIISHDKRLPALSGSDTIPLQYKTFDRYDTLIFDGLSSKGVSLVHKSSGHGVHMEFNDFPMIAFWTMANANAPYICLEPWHGCAAYDNESGLFEDKPHCIVLSSGESKSLRYTVSCLR